MFNRYREQGSTSVGKGLTWYTSCLGVQTSSEYNTHRSGTLTGMSDIVVPNFYVRSKRGEIFNNPMRKVKQTFSGGGTGNQTTTISCPTPPADAGHVVDWETSQRAFNVKFQFSPYRDELGHLSYPAPRLVDVESLRTIAATAALGDVDASTAQTLLTMSEAAKTLKTLANPLGATLKYLKSNPRPGRKGKAAAQAVSSQYLTWYYGIMPTMMEIENVLEALTTSPEVYRQTARGKATGTANETSTEVVGGCSKYTNLFTYSENVEIRSGILYLPSGGFDTVWGTRLSDIPLTAWELIPYSFVVDWFVNVGDFVAALSPRVGVSYLSAWQTLKMTQIWRAETLSSEFTCSGSTQTRSGSEWAQCVIETTQRYPVSPTQRVGLATKTLSFPVAKSLAAISLIIATLTRR